MFCIPLALAWPSPVVLYAVAGIFASLVAGTVVRLIALRHAEPDHRAQRLGSLRTWWSIVVLFALGLLLGRVGIVLLLALASALAVREFMTLSRIRLADFNLVGWTAAIVVLNYLWVYLGWRDVFVVFLPIAALMVLAVRMIVRDRAEGFLLTAAGTYWGLMLTVYFLSHAAMLATLSEASNPVAGPAGWLLYLLVLTSVSDISQALIGRRWGRRPVAPVLSPKKTQLGLYGGVAVTMALAAALAPLLTPLASASLPYPGGSLTVPYLPAALAGLMIGLAGYFGDITISGIKRDVGVKDSGKLLPGQGGILDRIDSLMFTAPLFYYFVVLTCGY